MRVCNVTGCPNPTESGRCLDHRREARAARTDNRVYDSPGHRSFRAAVITRDPICTLCHMAASTHADHYPQDRRELVRLGLNPDDPRYGRGLCTSCHSAETAQHQPGGWHRTQLRNSPKRRVGEGPRPGRR